ncbi:hypothetical protein N7470_002280 [Penicillium chermesinum]|nr:hypothetical protein N7470_002280 [Penicillium chermesinum]
MVKSDGNRCGRNCFNCPICTAPLAVSTIESVTGGGSQQGPWVLSCSYCMWTTLDIGIKFDKPTNIRSQLQKMTDTTAAPPFDTRTRQGSRAFADLKSPLSNLASVDEQAGNREAPSDQHITKQDQTATPSNAEAQFAALKSFYRNQISETSTSPSDPLVSTAETKKPNQNPPVMREALTPSEGLRISATPNPDPVISRLRSAEGGWDGVASIAQRAEQSPDVRFTDDLLPLPVLLRTKRAKRCKACKHILLYPAAVTTAPGSPSSTSAASAPSPNPDLNALTPLRPIHVLLTLKNHMFDPVRVTLATPSVTPGRVASKVTVLSPQFDIDPKLRAAEKVPEAGKVWDKGRNWTTVVLEVVPGTLPSSDADAGGGDGEVRSGAGSAPAQPDEDVLEIPVFVHMEWDAEGQLEQQDVGKASKPDDLVARELAYWMVLGVGRIQPSF